MRINKYISETGYCSRREVDGLIKSRKVTINGRVAELGSIVEEGDEVRVNGRPIGLKKAPIYLALYKPAGITSTTDQRDPTNIVDYVSYPERIFPIGRLDKDSEGLILLTNDGDIVNKILRAEESHEKEYIVTVDKPITQSFIRGMANGVRILGTITRKCKVSSVGDRVFRIILTEGKNRQIRRMCEVFCYEVTRLQRIRIMNVTVEGLKPGQYRELTKEELQELFEALSYDKRYDQSATPEKPQSAASGANQRKKNTFKNAARTPKASRTQKTTNRAKNESSARNANTSRSASTARNANTSRSASTARNSNTAGNSSFERNAGSARTTNSAKPSRPSSQKQAFGGKKKSMAGKPRGR